MRGRKNETLRSTCGQTLDELQRASVVSRVRDNYGVAMFSKLRLYAGEDRGEHGIGQIRHQYADKMGPAGPQRGRKQIAPVAEARGDFRDARDNIGRDQVGGFRIERAGCGRTMHASSVGDLLQSGAALRRSPTYGWSFPGRGWRRAAIWRRHSPLYDFS